MINHEISYEPYHRHGQDLAAHTGKEAHAARRPATMHQEAIGVMKGCSGEDQRTSWSYGGRDRCQRDQLSLATSVTAMATGWQQLFALERRLALGLELGQGHGCRLAGARP